MRARLSVLMFVQYMGIGAWAVPVATFLLASPAQGGLNFSPSQTSWIYSASAFVGLVAPLMLGLLADRLFAAEKVLGVLQFGGAAIMFFAGEYCRQRQLVLRTAVDLAFETRETFNTLFLFMLANAVVMVLTIALGNVISFRNLKNPKKYFGSIRLFGTVSWIVVNIGLDVLGSPYSVQPFYLSAICSLIAGIYAFTLPHTPPTGHGKSFGEAMGLPALGMFRHSGFRVLIISAMCMAAIQQFYSVYTNPFLKSLGAGKPTALQTISQFSEVACMLLFPLALSRFGMKWTLGVGIFGWVVRNAIFASGSLGFISAIGLPLHGMCYTFFFIVANVYVDRQAPSDLRASAQGIFTFISSGVGTLIGNFASARVLQDMRDGGDVEWTLFWLIPCVSALMVFLFFVIFYTEKSPLTEPARPIEHLAPNPVS
ncbi:MFS transporter [Zavarzinella formosa]|uniref:MFS transporter n=1 Tax=Zavarzinella formosa TaxID=360055 RepID=UPI0012F75F53|nr:MFS transporter [Zavarzinella formosa]